MSRRIFEKRVANDSPLVLSDSHEIQMSGGFSRADEDGPKKDVPKEQPLRRHITRPRPASVVLRQPLDDIARPEPKTSSREQRVDPSAKLPPGKFYAIFENRRLTASSQSVTVPNDIGPADQHTSYPTVFD